MKKNPKKKLLSHKIIRETFSGSNKYPGFQARMMATLIDLTLIGLLFTPLFSLIGNIIYGDVPPSEMINEATAEMVELYNTTGKKLDFMDFINNTPEYNNYFFKEYGLLKLAIYQIAQFLALATIVIVFWIKKQATPGKMFLSIKIVDATSLEKPSNRQLIIRLLSYIISILPAFLGIIWMVFDSKKQAWHDKISNTLVIKV